ncbi:uncharacterized protein LOC129905848 [Episyrphus balteatus]|uniref:uncharacterized protein LOC129905848 n=1 Tax=Episyrphus balteatus TaxID=286459 RepID=UPI0024860122|nr:uncharacterized protein LOC129905848 [Episyrphus balteatus]
MQALTFGATCSPCIAHYVKNQNAMSFSSSKPRAVEAILQHHYVDDFIDSTDTIDEATRLAKDVKYIHANAGFHVRNWMSNSSAVLNALQEKCERSNSSKAFGMNDSDTAITEKVLGMHWNTSCDSFTYVLNFNTLNRKVLTDLTEKKVPTKREVLKILMSIFDPMGFLSHFLVFVKILLQDIWSIELDWDEELPIQLYERCVRWQNLLPRVTELQIPRCYSSNLNQKGTSIQLHTFVDASENAYAAVSYFRIEQGNKVETIIVSAKTKVAPRRPLSIPRLELQAAVLGVRLMNSICNAHSFPISQKFLWSDSKAVLSWLRTEPRNFQQLVMYRVGEISESTNILDWKWIPSKLNVADKATKWNSDPEWDVRNEWFRGPVFLQKSSIEWPEMPTIQNNDKNEFRPHLLLINQMKAAINKLIDENRFRTWRKLMRSAAFVFMYMEKMK